MREHIWFTTQPIEEPDDPAQLVGCSTGSAGTHAVLDRFPHWDFDDSQYASSSDERYADGKC